MMHLETLLFGWQRQYYGDRAVRSLDMISFGFASQAHHGEMCWRSGLHLLARTVCHAALGLAGWARSMRRKKMDGLQYVPGSHRWGLDGKARYWLGKWVELMAHMTERTKGRISNRWAIPLKLDMLPCHHSLSGSLSSLLISPQNHGRLSSSMSFAWRGPCRN